MANSLPAAAIRQRHTTTKLMLLLGVTVIAPIISYSHSIAIVLKYLKIVVDLYLAIEY